jgi:hypothetical protein
VSKPAPVLKIDNEWKDAVRNLVKKLELSASIGMDTTFDSVGSAALAKLLRKMSEKLDIAVAMVKAMEEEK